MIIEIDRTGLSDAEVLAALYNVATPIGTGFIHYTPEPMTVEQAKKIIAERGDDSAAMFGREITRYYDYLKGRVMKLDVSENPLSLGLFERDNGEKSGQNAIKKALANKSSTQK